jgi:molecular chaperone GrpE
MSEMNDEQLNENIENLQKSEDEQLENEGKLPEKESDPISELEEKVSQINDKYLRLYSDFENYRKRTAKEKLELINSGNASLLLKILPVVDDFERAIESNKKVDDPKVLKEGFQLIYNKIKNILEAEGIKEMETNGKAFDVDFHESITHIPAPSKSLKGKVVDTTEKGYFLNDNVLRYAKVVVGS